MRKRALFVFTITVLCTAITAHAQSGQVSFGRATVEPAINDYDGSTIFLLTPNGPAIPSHANQRAVAPLYLVAYPSTSTIDPTTLNCQPDNCGHVNVLPFAAPGYVNGGTTCLQYGLPSGGCSLLLGHDHLVGVPPTGDFNVAWQVILVVFTQKGIDAGAADVRTLTLSGIESLVANGYAYEVPTSIIFNCSIVPRRLYDKGVPLHF